MSAALRDNRARSAGFTLVEVVVALTILSLIMLATVTGLRTLANTQGTLERVTARVDEVRTVSSFLRDLMEVAVVGDGGGSGGGLTLGGGSSSQSAYFEIGEGSLAWKATVLFGEGFGGSYLVQVAREDDLLLLRWLAPPLGRAPVDWSLAASRPLVLGVEEFAVAWRGAIDQPWQQQWQKGDRARWVRLQVKAAGRYWPELIMQVPQ
ncbi:MAG: prepilin-type N-terminal cleavage/methylation domain-containing protein [Halieaceae bacterium]|nr:prepilin-type N-terminal cleavage/methylation domain-containing protein [Halieaceae bacterium]